MAESWDNQLQMLAIEHILDLLALDIGDDFVEEHNGLVVDILFVLSVNWLKFIHYSTDVVDELLFISPSQRVQSFDGLWLEDDGALC